MPAADALSVPAEVEGEFPGAGGTLSYAALHFLPNLLTIHMIVCIIHTMNSRDVIRGLRRDGWERRNITGSHHHFTHPDKPGIVTVAHTTRDIPTGTLRNIFRQADWDWRNR